MGFLKNIAKKVKNAIASLKSSSSSKVLAKADLNLVNQTIKGNQLLNGRPNFDEKRYEYEDNATKHFATFFKGKTLQDVEKFVTDIRNFSSESEFVRQIDSANRKRAMAGDKSRLTISDLYKYFAGGQGLSEKDIASYRQIASQTQARARALSYIKSNFIGICNMNDLSSQKDRESFDAIMNVVKAYADKDINNYAVTDFDRERVNSIVLNSDDVYLKGVAYAEIRTREMFEKQIDKTIEIATEAKDIVTAVKEDGQKIDENLDKIVALNKIVEDKTNENSKIDTLNEKLNEVYTTFAEEQENQKLARLWISGSRHSRGEKKAILNRQEEFLNELAQVAKNFQIFGTRNGEILVKDGENFISIDEASETENFDLFYAHAGEDLSYNQLAKLIELYNEDNAIVDGDEKTNNPNAMFVVKVDKHANPKIYTADQDRIMADIYQRLVEHATSVVNEENYKGTNALKDFGYKNFRHSISNDTLANMSKVLFGSDFDKDTVAPTYDELTGAQIDALFDFIVNNDPVKSLLSNSDVKTFEIDKLLTDAINPDSRENIENPEKCMLNAVMNNMRVQNLEMEIDRCENTKVENENIVEQNSTDRDDLFAEILETQQNIRENLEKASNLEAINYAELKYNVDTENYSAQNMINYFLYFVTLPQSAEELGTEQSNVVKYKDCYNGKAYRNFDQSIRRYEHFINKANSDRANFDKLSLEEKAKLYAQYFSESDKETVEEFVNQIDEMIKSDNVLTTADVGLEEREF